MLRNIGIYTFGNALPQLINIILLPVFTRYLTKEEYGILNYTTALSVFLFLFGSLSLNAFLLRNYFQCESEEERKTLYGTITIFLVGFNLVLIAASTWLLPDVFSYLQVKVPFSPFVKIALVVNFVDILATIPLSYFRVRKESGRFVALSLSNVVLGTILSLYFVVGLKMGLIGRYLGLLGTSAIMLIIYSVFIFQISRFRIDIPMLRAGFAFSIPLLPAVFFQHVGNFFDRFVLERFISLELLGIYGVGQMVGSGMSFLVNAVYKSIEPDIYGNEGHDDLLSRVQASQEIMFRIFVVTGLIVMMFSREFIILMVAPKFLESYVVAAVIAFTMILEGMTIPANCYLIALGATRVFPLIGLFLAVASVGTNLLFIPIWGVKGALVARVTTSISKYFVFLLVSQRVGRIRWNFKAEASFLAAAGILGSMISLYDFTNLLLVLVVKIIVVFFLLVLAVFGVGVVQKFWRRVLWVGSSRKRVW